MIVSKKQHTSMIVGKTLPTPKPQRGGSLQTKARRLLRMDRKDAEPIVIDLLRISLRKSHTNTANWETRN